MKKGNFETGLQHLAQAYQLAQLLQRAAAQRVPITLPNAPEDGLVHLGAEHIASIVRQCELRALELGGDLEQLDFSADIGKLAVDDLSPKLQRMHELVVRFFDSTQSTALSGDSELEQMCLAFEELMALEIDCEARSDDFIRDVRMVASIICCPKLCHELESSRGRVSDERREHLSQVLYPVRDSPRARGKVNCSSAPTSCCRHLDTSSDIVFGAAVLLADRVVDHGHPDASFLEQLADHYLPSSDLRSLPNLLDPSHHPR